MKNILLLLLITPFMGFSIHFTERFLEYYPLDFNVEWMVELIRDYNRGQEETAQDIEDSNIETWFLDYIIQKTNVEVEHLPEYIRSSKLDVEKIRQLLLDHTTLILENETEKTIGYHGHGEYYRVFQDILKATHKVILGYETPDDFYFLRVPHHPRYADLGNTPKQDYLHREKMPEEAIQDLIIECFFGIENPQFTKEEKEEIMTLFWAVKEKNYTEGQFFSDFKHEFAYDLPALLLRAETLLNQKIDIDELKEDQARSTFMDFIFAKLPLLEHSKQRDETDDKFDNFIGSIGDMGCGSSNVLAMNPSFFTGWNGSEGTLGHFLFGDPGVDGSGETWSNEDLEFFFEEIGLDPTSALEVIKTGLAAIKENNISGGYLLQLIDDTEDRSLINKISYISLAAGEPVAGTVDIPTTDLLNGNSHFTIPVSESERKEAMEKDWKEDPDAKEWSEERFELLKRFCQLWQGEHFQIRLIFDNRIVLNPNSGFRVKRYDFNSPPGAAEKVMEAIEQKLLELPLDTAKRDDYVRRLKFATEEPSNGHKLEDNYLLHIK